MSPISHVIGTLLATTLAVGTHADQSCDEDVVTFSEGLQGWIGTNGSTGSTQLEKIGGNPAHHLHTVFNDFGIEFYNDTNADHHQALLSHDQVTIEIDLKVEEIEFFGTPVTRPWVLEIRDYDDVPPGLLWVSVWYLFEWVGAEDDWRTFGVTITDTTSGELPEGWGGTGGEAPPDYEPALPANRTFASVLASADEIAFTTYQPGWGFGFTDFDVRIDNIRIIACPKSACPADFNGDGLVDGQDLARLLARWGACEGDCPEDLNGNGFVDSPDLGIMLGYWGTCGG